MQNDLGPLAGRVAGAPISWGVCEVPGWGVMLRPSRVLPEMQALGLTATELGAPGFLPGEAPVLNAELAAYAMSLVGGFVPLVLHDPAQRADAIRRARETAELFSVCGATRFVTAVVQDYDWSRPVPLDAEGMKVLATGLAEVDQVCAEYGLTQVLHPHVDTLVETEADVELALEHTSVLWCLDTGHLQIGGVDPAEFARVHGDRVGHVHLKDVRNPIAVQVRRGDLGLMRAVQQGLFCPLGAGDVEVDEVMLALESGGYQGWYVLEQDAALPDEPPAGVGPSDDIAASLAYIASRVASKLDPALRADSKLTAD
ncbi:MAG: TIM barrel protein [Nocardioidaceae bacterium]|nr:MAG: TIM barrel protein [Nocardioidaceae bacterium]